MHVMIMFILVSSTKLLPVFSSYNNFPIAAKSSCNDTCGNIRIPFPFGISKNCYLDDQFALTCNHTSFKLFSGPIEITDISIDGQITFLQSIAYQCYDSNGIQSSNFSEGIQLGSYFTVNNTANKFTMILKKHVEYKPYSTEHSMMEKMLMEQSADSSNEVTSASSSSRCSAPADGERIGEGECITKDKRKGAWMNAEKRAAKAARRIWAAEKGEAVIEHMQSRKLRS
ncbi:hypothetical protein SASPL_153461 [Salvia splendens]|uniref:Wall-associated receptor kinase galacturonan-binding domain-containing protein n=1 Tax=Salvia splendens TaxID=180675 RepID=A0A8X8Z1X1_SALSN|nr:hypothetical protein SASPL_153461 [Salvia splendens]